MKHLYALTLLACSFCGFAQQKNVQEMVIPRGHIGTFSQKLFEDSLTTSFIIIIPKEVKLHRHDFHSEHVYVQSGEAKMKLGNEMLHIKAGDVVFIPKGTPHQVEVTSQEPLKVISIQAPLFDGKDRIMMEQQANR